MVTDFPVDTVLPDLLAALVAGGSAVLIAPPGAGKTTRVPPALIAEKWMAGKKLLMLEPRRLAARRAAEFMSSLLSERVGQTVGYRIRGESRVSPSTRIEVVTEGILTRMLHDNPDLSGVGIVVFDEFHERSIHADLGLAFTLEAREHLRPDLRVLVMSATLDQVGVGSLLGDARVIQSEGTSFPVETRYARAPLRDSVEREVSSAVIRALRETSGDLLVFLPGQREIRRTAELLDAARLGDRVQVHLLYGDADPAQQRDALVPSQGSTRKVILSTSIAETSLTIDGVRVVIDAGFSRLPRFDARRGMAGLATVPVSVASADQRRGRAGRQAPGVCYRLWPEAQTASLLKYTPPEILSTDLMPLALDLALWGDPLGERLRFLDRPPAGHLAQARSVLAALGAFDVKGAVTPHGKTMSHLSTHPRLAHMILKAKELGSARNACLLAAVLSERDVLRGNTERDVDLTVRWEAIEQRRGVDPGVLMRIGSEAERLSRMVSAEQGHRARANIGALVALAYPDRVGAKHESDERYLLVNGTAAVLPPRSQLSKENLLAIAEVDGSGASARILLAAPLERADLEKVFADRLHWSEETVWDETKEAVVACRKLMIGEMIVDQRSIAPTGFAARSAFLEGIGAAGLEGLPWSEEAVTFRQRSEWVRVKGLAQAAWPVLDDATLRASFNEWLGPFVDGMTRRTQLQRVDFLHVLRSRFTYQQLKELDRLAPERIIVPTGSSIRIAYDPQAAPVLAVKLQELFGQISTPTVGGGKIPVVIHLLSPAGRPLAVTQDLPSFWKNAYPEVAKQMRGRYPKHPWPEDPLRATPTRRTKRRS